MRRIETALKRTVLGLFCALLIGTGMVTALEISDLHLPLTRDVADDTLSKDYVSEVLNDGTLRRTWHLKNRKVFVDFDVKTGEAILIAVVYEKPVATKVGLADAKALANGKFAKGSKWTPPKNDAASKMLYDDYGLENVLRRMLEDNSMLFCETDKDKKKIRRISAFAAKPKTNRWELLTIEPRGNKTTAMGGSVGPNDVDEIYKDEDRRRTIPLASSSGSSTATAPTPSDTSSSTNARRPHRTVMGSRGGYSGEDDVYQVTGPSIDSLDTLDSSKASGGKREEGSLGFTQAPPDWLKKVGIKQPEWWHYIALGIGGLVLLLAIISSIAKSSSRAKQRKQYKKLVPNAPLQGKTRINKR